MLAPVTTPVVPEVMVLLSELLHRKVIPRQW